MSKQTTPDDESLIEAYNTLSGSDRPSTTLLRSVRTTMARRQRRRRRTRVAVIALSAAVVATVLVGGIWMTSPTIPVTTSPGMTGALPQSASQSCVYEYSAKTLAERDWAADVTVEEIKLRRGASWESAQVIMRVNAWYRGGGDGSTSTMSVTMPSPWTAEDAPPAYGIGTRLLASGDRSDATTWGWACGFTRYYDEASALNWKSILS